MDYLFFVAFIKKKRKNIQKSIGIINIPPNPFVI